MFGLNKTQQIEVLASAIEKSVVRLEPGKKYILVIPADGTDADREEWAKTIEERIGNSEVSLVVVFAEWAKMIEFA